MYLNLPDTQFCLASWRYVQMREWGIRIEACYKDLKEFQDVHSKMYWEMLNHLPVPLSTFYRGILVCYFCEKWQKFITMYAIIFGPDMTKSKQNFSSTSSICVNVQNLLLAWFAIWNGSYVGNYCKLAPEKATLL